PELSAGIAFAGARLPFAPRKTPIAVLRRRKTGIVARPMRLAPEILELGHDRRRLELTRQRRRAFAGPHHGVVVQSRQPEPVSLDRRAAIAAIGQTVEPGPGLDKVARCADAATVVIRQAPHGVG